MLYNLINPPNLMGARRSCGQSNATKAVVITRFFNIASSAQVKKYKKGLHQM
jgi:hypothetical protein